MNIEQEKLKQIKTQVLNRADTISYLRLLTRYEMSTGGCGDSVCCGSWVEHSANKDGNWVKFDDIKVLIEQLQN